MIHKLTETLKKWNWLYAFIRETKKLKADRKLLWKDAVRKFGETKPKKGSLQDYRRALMRHRVSYKEYDTYRFFDLDEKERNAYLSEREMKCIYRKLSETETLKWLDDKILSHEKFAPYMQRAWICPKSCSFDDFKQFVVSRDCIIKPSTGSLGKGVFLVRQADNVDLKALYERCRQDCLIVEERLSSCQEIAEFHPQSLNTIRVMTMSNGGKTEVIGSVFRMGVGDSIVDNGAEGGILAPIDSEAGVIIGDGRDEDGHIFKQHPDSGKTIKGFHIPYWRELIEACKKMASLVPDIRIVGWDLCVCADGRIEMIEVNSGPHIMVLQTAYGMGLKPRTITLGKELYGCDLMQLTRVFKAPRVNYYEKEQYLRSYREAYGN